MRDSLGGSMLLNLVIIFAGLVIIVFIGILSYSKAYKVKNRIVEIIEKYESYNSSVVAEINPDLSAAGYNTSNSSKNCEKVRKKLLKDKYNDLSLNLNEKNGYNYCVFEIDSSSNSTGKHYLVTTFIHFQIPIIGDVLTFPVYGETKILGKTYDY